MVESISGTICTCKSRGHVSSIQDDSGDPDDNSAVENRKKRRSWKGHRVEGMDGMYACDQCDKVFGKQSSLARHKYEHSGESKFLFLFFLGHFLMEVFVNMMGKRKEGKDGMFYKRDIVL